MLKKEWDVLLKNQQDVFTWGEVEGMRRFEDATSVPLTEDGKDKHICSWMN